jgi:diadenosine tetraphosphate (Ap4A) HIT family hydrolase
LTDSESASLGRWLPALTSALHAATGCELEYVMQFAEGDGFQHVHFHVIARARDWPAEYKGPRVFAAWSVTDPVSGDEAARVIEAVGAHLGVEPTRLVE